MFSITGDLHLSQADIDHLMTNPSPDQRAETAVKISYNLDRGLLSKEESQLAFDILRLLTNDTALQVRQAIAESLKASIMLPHDIALKLAEDIEMISLPLLELTPVLSDQDLINIIYGGNGLKQAAIARRPHVSEEVAGILAEHGLEDAIGALAANKGAEIGTEGLQTIINRFGQNPDILNPLVQREILPATIIEQIINVASDEIKKILLRRTDLPREMIDRLSTSSREKVIIDLVSHDRSDSDIEQMVHQLQINRRLTPSLILRAVCMGDLQFFEIALSVISHLPLKNVRILLQDKGQSGFRSIYQKCGLPMAFMPAAHLAVQMADNPEFAQLDEPARHEFLQNRLRQSPDGMSASDISNLFAQLEGLRALSS